MKSHETNKAKKLGLKVVPEYREMDGLTGAELPKRTPEIERLSFLAAVKIQLECLRDIIKRKAK